MNAAGAQACNRMLRHWPCWPSGPRATLAAHQEIEKLRLLAGPGPLGAEQVLASVADSARFDVFQLQEALLAGDAARALRAWQHPRQATALEQGRRRAVRLPFTRLTVRAARADRMIKGRLPGNPWDELALLAVEICARELRPAARCAQIGAHATHRADRKFKPPAHPNRFA